MKPFHSVRTFLLLGLLFLGGVVGSPAADAAIDAPPRLALLVGVSKYPQSGKRPWRPLNTHHEIDGLRQILIKKFGFADKDVKVLEDEQASAQAIRDAWKQHLIGKARRGAVVFFHFSGHGMQVQDRNGDELDGRDESLVPGDATEQDAVASEKTNILDDEIGVWLRTLGDRMRAPGSGKVDGSIVLSFDSCFSGTLSRGELIERGRGWDETIDGPLPQTRGGDVSAKTPTFDLAADDYVVMSAARSYETAKELDGGLYSRALISALDRLSTGISYRTLLHEVTVDVRRAVLNQNPEFEGNLDRGLFGARVMPAPVPYLSAMEVHGDMLKIAAGSLHLVALGSIYALHKSGDAKPDAQTLLGEAEVIEVRPMQSTLRLRRNGGNQLSEANVRGARLVEKQRSYKNTPLLRVRCQEGTGPCKEQLREALRHIDAVQLVDGAAANGVDHDVKIVVSANGLSIYRPESGTPVTTLPLSDGGVGDNKLETWLRAEWRFRQLLGLRVSDPYLQAGLRLAPATAQWNMAHQVTSAQPIRERTAASLRLREDEIYLLEVTNRSTFPIYVTLLEMWPDGTIKVWFPRANVPGEALIAAGTTRTLERPILSATPPYGLYRWKIIATTQQTELRQLAQDALSISRETLSQRAPELKAQAAANPLTALVIEALSGRMVRSDEKPTAFGDFIVDDALLEVVAK